MLGKNSDPHMKSPFLKIILIILVIALIIIYVAPKVVDIYNDNLDDMNERESND